MKKKYDSPATVVLTINHVTLLKGNSLSSNGRSLKLNSIENIETKDASNAASRSYELDDD